MSKADQDSPEALASATVNAAVRLVRWLKAGDPAPQLTGAQVSALAVIVHSGGIRPADLARIEEVKRPTMARVITALVARGLVTRQAVARDGRGALLTATAEGAALLAQGQARRCRPLAAALEGCDAGERAAIALAMRHLEAIVAGGLARLPAGSGAAAEDERA